MSISPFVLAGDLMFSPLKDLSVYRLMFVNEKGHGIEANRANVKRLISGDSWLLKKYKEQDIVYTYIMERFLLKFNERNRN